MIHGGRNVIQLHSSQTELQSNTCLCIRLEECNYCFLLFVSNNVLDSLKRTLTVCISKGFIELVLSPKPKAAINLINKEKQQQLKYRHMTAGNVFLPTSTTR